MEGDETCECELVVPLCLHELTLLVRDRAKLPVDDCDAIAVDKRECEFERPLVALLGFGESALL